MSVDLIAVLDMGASAVRLVVAEVATGQPPRIIEEGSRGVLLGRDTFSSGAIRPQTAEATLVALEGFRHIAETYKVSRVRAVATSAVREARNSELFLDRIRGRTGIEFEVINEAEESRLVYLAVRDKEPAQLRPGFPPDAQGVGDALVSAKGASEPPSPNTSVLAKSILELGIVGLALIAAVLGSIVVRGFRIRRRLRDPGLIAMASAILGLMIWGIAYTVKAQYLDFDPLNLYFWLFTGVLFKLAVIDRAEAAPRERPPETKSSLPPSQPVRVPQQA